MQMRGCFTLRFPGRKPIRLWNTVPQQGQLAFLEYLFQNDNTNFPATLYLGLCDQAASNTLKLSDITTEPTETNGYSRIALARNAVDWPTITEVGGYHVARSKEVVWTATGGDFSREFTRAFLCNVSTGTAGYLISISGALTEPALVQDTQTFSAEYEVFVVAPP